MRFVPVLAVLFLAGCTAAAPAPAPSQQAKPAVRLFDAATVHGALAEPSAFGGSWTKTEVAPDKVRLPYLCAALVLGPSITAPADTATKGAWLQGGKATRTALQYAIVYPDVAAAGTALGNFHAAATGCAPSVNVPRKTAPDGKGVEPAYTEKVQVKDYTTAEWSGFVVTRPKRYTERGMTSGATSVVAVVGQRNAIVVLAYAYYGSANPPPDLTKSWQQPLGVVLGHIV